MWQYLWVACGLMLIIEGFLPFVAPTAWREVFRRMIEMKDGQLRFFGLTSMIIGLLLITVSRLF